MIYISGKKNGINLQIPPQVLTGLPYNNTYFLNGETLERANRLTERIRK